MCRFKTSPCVGSRRFRVYRQNAHMFSTCAFCRYTRRRLEPTHGGFSACQAALHTDNTHHTTTQLNNNTTIHHNTTHTKRTSHTLSAHTPHTRMLGYAHSRQPTVILRRKSECLDMCTDAPPTMILHSIKICNICNVCNFMRTILFLELIGSAKIISEFFSYRNVFGIS